MTRLSILPNNPEVVSKNAWINNVKETLEEKGSEWTFTQAVQHFNDKGSPFVKKGKCGISSVQGKKGCGNQNKRNRNNEAEEQPSNNPNASAQPQKEGGFKNSGEPTKDIIKGINISLILRKKGRIATDKFKQLPHIVKIISILISTSISTNRTVRNLLHQRIPSLRKSRSLLKGLLV